MRISIFPRGGTPATHAVLCRKKLAYCEDMVLRGLLAPLDSSDIRKGCVVVGNVDLRERGPDAYDYQLMRASGWGFSNAWGIRPSGPTGIGVWQLQTR
jgi:hypothetical protein